LACLACGGSQGTTRPIPDNPNAALTGFLEAVKANDLERMGTLWGNERGPAANWMKADELNQRLTIMQRYLAHASSRVVEGPLTVPGRTDQRTYRVELTRQQCVRVQPIDVIRVRSGGWVVLDARLGDAARPVGPCAEQGTPD
jgi:hypothetical protein